MYEKQEAEFIARAFETSKHNIISCNNNISIRLQEAKFSRDEDKTKSITNWFKETKDSSNQITPFGIILENLKANGSSVLDALKKNEIKVGSDVIVANQTKTEVLNTFGLKYIYYMNLYKNVESLLNEQVTKGFCNHHYFISDKEYMKKRNLMVLDSIEPVNFVKFCKSLKKLSTKNSVNKEKQEIFTADDLFIENDNKDSPMSIKVSNQEYSISISSSESMTQLGLVKKEPFFFIIRLLEKRNLFELKKVIPTTYLIEPIGSEPDSQVSSILTKAKR